MNNRIRQRMKIYKCNSDLFVNYLYSLLTEEDKDHIRNRMKEILNEQKDENEKTSY